MKITILGSGTSTGVPLIGCECSVCSSDNRKNKRMRASVVFTLSSGGEDKNLLVDTSTDMRMQVIGNNIKRISGVLFTHKHADHIHGIDDLRAFNLTHDGPIPCFGNESTIDRVHSLFSYIFEAATGDKVKGGWKPSLVTEVIDGDFTVAGIKVVPLEVDHGKDKIYGFRIGRGAYITDCSGVPDETMEKLKDLDVLILGALRHKPHPTHFTIAQAVEVSRKIGARRTVFTHLSHDIDFEKENKALPDGIELAYDGMVLEY